MDESDRVRVQEFLDKWQGSEGNERANYQGFFKDLCRALNVEEPPPKGKLEGDPYCFDKDIKFYSDKKETTRFADFYKEGCFLIEAKQGSNTSNKGHGKRGTKAYLDNMQGAFNQAKSYAYNRMLRSQPPFLITCDIGSHFEVWEGFSGEYGSYGARQRVNLADLLDKKVFDRFVLIFTDPQALNPEKYRARVTREVAATLAELSQWLEGNPPHPLTPSPTRGEAGSESTVNAGASPSLPSPVLGEGPGVRETHTQAVAQFLMRCIFTMFAEDVGLLREEIFTGALRDRWIPQPHRFKPEIEQLWQTMNTGGSFGFESVLRFNGSFFEDATAFELPKDQLEVLYEAAKKDWSQVEPAIFGTLVERALSKQERSRLGAHYTPRSYVERLVRPVVMEPLRQEWDEIELEIKRLMQPTAANPEPTTRQRNAAEKEIRAFLEKLRTIRILDPACGTGNFLYVSFDLMKGLEDEVLTRLEDVTGQRRDQLMLDIGEVQINPAQFLGIEINPRAAAIAELVIWIGYLQWQFRQRQGTGFVEPVLQAFGNIECRDAVLAYDGREPDVDGKTGLVRTRWGGRMMTHPVTGEEVPDPSDQVVIYRYLNPRPAEWPEADYVVSNPPFVGNRDMRVLLGDGYSETLRDNYQAVPDTVDFVMYWWHKAAELTREQKLNSFGFITTKTIRQVRQRKVIDFHLNQKKPIKLFFTIPNHPWPNDGADVRIAMTAASIQETTKKRLAILGTVVDEGSEGDPEEIAGKLDINFMNVGNILSDLRAGVSLDVALSLKSNADLCSDGVKPYGSGFLLSQDEFKALENPKSLTLVKRFKNGRDVNQTSRNILIK